MKKIAVIFKWFFIVMLGLSIMTFLMGAESMVDEKRWTLLTVWGLINVVWYFLAKWTKKW